MAGSTGPVDGILRPSFLSKLCTRPLFKDGRRARLLGLGSKWRTQHQKPLYHLTSGKFVSSWTRLEGDIVAGELGGQSTEAGTASTFLCEARYSGFRCEYETSGCHSAGLSDGKTHRGAASQRIEEWRLTMMRRERISLQPRRTGSQTWTAGKATWQLAPTKVYLSGDGRSGSIEGRRLGTGREGASLKEAEFWIATGAAEDLTPLPSLKAAGNTHIDFDGSLSLPLMLHEDVRTGCGGQTWPAGMVLGKHMLRLELGAGGGLVGLAVALGCGVQSPLYLTDQDEMLKLMQRNIELNHVETRAEAMVLNWGEALSKQVLEQKPNVILAAECVYFEPAFPLLMVTLKLLLELNAEAIVYFCFKKRRRADMHFVKMARKAFKVEEIFDEDRPIFQRKGLFLFSFTSRTPNQITSQTANKSATKIDMHHRTGLSTHPMDGNKKGMSASIHLPARHHPWMPYVFGRVGRQSDQPIHRRRDSLRDGGVEAWRRRPLFSVSNGGSQLCQLIQRIDGDGGQTGRPGYGKLTTGSQTPVPCRQRQGPDFERTPPAWQMVVGALGTWGGRLCLMRYYSSILGYLRSMDRLQPVCGESVRLSTQPSQNLEQPSLPTTSTNTKAAHANARPPAPTDPAILPRITHGGRAGD
ncbi:hypothetical protein G7046_g7446 [Stylonectria norvegica]|nr:hypothetical protein G7046_g7446 [Stylonectria norvegica]